MKARGSRALLAEARRHLLRFGAVLALTVVSTLLYAGTAWAETFTVTNTSGTGTGSLREAINKANSTAGADEIVFADGVSGTITLASTLPTIMDSAGLVIDGGGDVTVSGNHAVRVFKVGSEAKLTLRNLTIADGEVRGTNFVEGGSGIYNEGTLALTNSTIAGGEVRGRDFVFGGSIYSAGTLTLTNSTIADGELRGRDEVYGGGVYNEFGATVKAKNSTVSGNKVSAQGSGLGGGGIYNEFEAKLEVTNSTISGNKVWNRSPVGCCWGAGGGIYNSFDATAKVVNSTISGNSADKAGGGILNEGKLTLTNGTISGNGGVPFFGSGVYNGWDGTATLRNTIVANSTLGPNCYGSIIDGGYNIEDADTCRFKRATGSLPKTDPLLDPAGLSDNGGPTQTIALQPDSPAVDLVGQSACPPPQTDQRGVMRPQGETCDSGAFELVQEPQSKADCKKGGYKEFGFKSQGKCIAFVNRTARNQ
jgi:hypothetical protein